MARLQFMRDALARAEDCYAQAHPKAYFLPGRNCWAVPYDGVQFCDAAQELLKKIILTVNRHHLKIGYSNGLLLVRYDEAWKQFLFVDIADGCPAEELKKHKEILRIPEGRYLCRKVEHSDINQAWTWSEPYLQKEQIQLILETELFIGNYCFPAPALEQQCLVVS